MFPSLAEDDFSNVILVYAKCFTELSFGETIFVELSYFYYTFFSKLGVRIFDSIYSAFFRLVSHVLSIISYPQMPWINTSRVVAFMKDLSVLWNLTKMNFPRNPVGRQGSFFKTNVAISRTTFRGCPFPTYVKWNFFDLAPKSFLECLHGEINI